MSTAGDSRTEGTPRTRSTSGWAGYRWCCPQKQHGGFAVADHDRREFPKEFCRTCLSEMVMVMFPLAYEDVALGAGVYVEVPV